MAQANAFANQLVEYGGIAMRIMSECVTKQINELWTEKNMPEIEYIYPDVSCPRCKTKRGITLSNGVAGCSICGSEVAKAKKHVSVKMSDTVDIR